MATEAEAEAEAEEEEEEVTEAEAEAGVDTAEEEEEAGNTFLAAATACPAPLAGRGPPGQPYEDDRR